MKESVCCIYLGDKQHLVVIFTRGLHQTEGTGRLCSQILDETNVLAKTTAVAALLEDCREFPHVASFEWVLQLDSDERCLLNESYAVRSISNSFAGFPRAIVVLAYGPNKCFPPQTSDWRQPINDGHSKLNTLAGFASAKSSIPFFLLLHGFIRAKVTGGVEGTQKKRNES